MRKKPSLKSKVVSVVFFFFFDKFGFVRGLDLLRFV